MNHFIRILCIAAITAFSASAVLAESLELETITITAEKRKADSQQVALPVSVLTDTFVEDMEIESVKDVGKYVPNIFIDNNWGLNQTYILLRGMSGSSFLATNPVVLNVDGLPSDSTYGFDTTFENIERIEVLRGPQGTLYGKNSMSGAINIITKKPGNEYTGFIGFSAEERSGYGFNTSLSGPVVRDKYYFGLSGGYRTTDGYINDTTPGGEDDISGSKKHNYTLKLSATPNRKTDIMLKYSRNYIKGVNPPAVTSSKYTNDIYTGFTSGEVEDTVSVTDVLLLNTEFRTKAVDIAWITSYKNVDSDENYLMGNRMKSAQDFTMPTLTQELRFASPEKKGIKWLAGLYADINTMDMDEASSSMYNGGSFYEYLWMFETESKTYAVFSEVTIPCWGERLAFTLGVRHENTKREMDYGYALKYDGVTGYENSYDVDKSWGATLGKAAVSYQASKNINLYASISQGYTPGGFNYTTDVKELADFNETKSLNYEIGIKTKLLDNKLMFNANVFHAIYDDLQVFEADVLTNVYTVKNVGKAHSTGIETDIMYRPARGLDIFATAGITDSKYDDFEVSSVEYDGNYVVGAPRYTATIGATYRHKSGFMGSFDIKQTGKTYFTKENNDDKLQDAYAIVNAKIGYESLKGYEIYLYARNLTDEDYFTYMRDTGSSYGYNFIGEPGTFGIAVNYRF